MAKNKVNFAIETFKTYPDFIPHRFDQIQAAVIVKLEKLRETQTAFTESKISR